MKPDLQAPHATAGKRSKLSEAIRHADDRGVTLSDRYLARLVRRTGWQDTLRYIDKLAEIMDTAAALGIDCPQTLASRRLSLANGDAQSVVDGLSAEARRRADRERAGCNVIVPPRDWRERANAYANCGCPCCFDRLAIHMQSYIRVVKLRLCDGLEPDEALGEAHLELAESLDRWKGGPNFPGFFGERFEKRVLNIYKSRCREEREMLSLNVEDTLDRDGELRVSLLERVPDRSTNVLTIVLCRELCWEWLLAQHRARVDRLVEYARAGRTNSSCSTGTQARHSEGDIPGCRQASRGHRHDARARAWCRRFAAG